MRLIDVKALLALRTMARAAAGDFFALDSMRHYLLDSIQPFCRDGGS